MAIVIINPNSTEAMTVAMLEAAQSMVPSLEFEGWTSHKGPPSIQGEADGLTAAPYLLELVAKAERGGADGVIIGCFDDTALTEAAALVECPVIGIGQASYHFAALRGWRFSVVTTLSVSVPVLEANVETLGLRRWLGRVRASEVPVLELDASPDAAIPPIRAEALLAQEQDDIDAVVLGCAGMVHVTSALRHALSIPVIDPVEAAAHCMSWLAPPS